MHDYKRYKVSCVSVAWLGTYRAREWGTAKPVAGSEEVER